MGQAEEYTVFIKNSIAFPYFGHEFVRNNLVANNGMPCMFKQDPETKESNGCQIFKLGEMLAYAGGNFSLWVLYSLSKASSAGFILNLKLALLN